MKIAILTPGGVDRSGTERVIPCLLWLIERLVRAGNDVHVFAFTQEPAPGSWPLLGSTVHNAGRRLTMMRALKMLRAEHRRGRFDVLHAFWAIPCGLVGAAAARLLRLPLVITLPGGDVAREPQIGYGGRVHLRNRLKLAIVAAAADAVTVPSEAMRRQAEAARVKALRLPLGVALDRWPRREPLEREPNAPLRLLYVGNLNAVKDPATLLRAAARLKVLGLPFELEIVGYDTRDGADERMALALGLDCQVQFRGFLPHHELRPMFERADLLVVTSVHEAGPIVCLEAAIAGLPTVGTAVGHIADFAPAAAIAVGVGDWAALADAIRHLAENEPERLRLAHAAQVRAVREDADFTCGRFVDLYEKVLCRDLGCTGAHA